MTTRIGSLFSGYGGLDLAVHDILGAAETVWVSDIDKGACKILAHRYPEVPNLGDISTVDWAAVEPVDVLTGGFPCQDVSHAGKRAGLRPDTRSGLWSQMAYAVDQLRPALVVAENVRGLLSAKAHSDLEPCPWCLGDRTDVSALRALGAVLGDLADLGYDACWYGLRAADVGAPHGRFRVFVVAWDAHRPGLERRWSGQRSAGERAAGPTGGQPLLPTPATSDTNGAGVHGDGGLDLRTAVSLLPTPAVNDMGAAHTPDTWDEWTDDMKAKHGNGNGHGKSLAIEAQRLLPTPRSTRGGSTTETSYGLGGERSDEHRPQGTVVVRTDAWGDYAPAIHRWEATIGRPAPAPTVTSNKGNPQLAPGFVEWMMGLPPGWVTDTPDLTRNQALKALGNGVVPPQAAAALRLLLPHIGVTP